MYLDNLLPPILAGFASPGCLLRKLREPSLVSFGLMANLACARRHRKICNIDAIIDVGANIGQYAYMAHYVWAETPIFSFEPDPRSHAQLRGTFDRYGIPGQCFELAVGAARDVGKFRVQANSEQSSFLARLDKQGGSQGEISVQSTTLCDFGMEQPDIERGLLKIDTQGYEMEVLAGAGNFLRQCAYVQLEVAFRPEYEGQAYVADLLNRMREVGFVCVEILDILRDKRLSGHPIAEADLLFARAS